MANAHVDLDRGPDDNSIESSAEDYGIEEQECEDVFNENKYVAVVCVMTTEDNPFNSLLFSPSTGSAIPSAIPNISRTLEDILILDDKSTDNNSVI